VSNAETEMTNKRKSQQSKAPMRNPNVEGYDGVPSRCTTVVMLERDSSIGTLAEPNKRTKHRRDSFQADNSGSGRGQLPQALICWCSR
jgi:hypothetical protein